ncbi:TPA: restriction endonuclease subunit S [Listeria innocua]|nr:restriction endonuclease subunit S [Listeria innocua]
MAKIDDSVKKKVPELRFKGFTDEWEQRKLGDEVRIVMGQSPNSENYTDDPNDYILVQGNADMKNGRVLPRVWTTQVTKQAEKDDLILSVRAPVGDIGKTAYDVVIGRGVAAIKGNEFIFQSLGKMKSDGYWTRYSTGSTFESINSTDIKEAIISVPAIEEQDKIGSFFKQLDKTITLHQRKLDLLKEQKKGYLQKMFPKNGAKVPELRFEGFTDDWEERKLKDISEIIDGDRGKNYPSGDDFKNNGHTLFLSATNVTKQGFVFKKNQYITNLKSESLGNGKVKLNDIILTSRGSIGHIGFYDEKINEKIPQARINSGMLILRTDKFNSPNFIAQFLKSPLGIKQIKLISFGSAQPQLTKKDIKKFKIALPKIEEQQKIGSLLKQIDNTIALHQRKLDLLKEQKKGFLQKMFV